MNVNNLDRKVLVPATAARPRNMGADIIKLSDGRLFLAYTEWLSGATDADCSQVAGMVSDDNGDSWSDPFTVMPPFSDVHTVRMPCLWRRTDGSLMAALRCATSEKDTWVGQTGCIDESLPCFDAWLRPERISPPPPGRHILLSNRMVRLRSGRLVLPLASNWPWDVDPGNGLATPFRSWCLLSDDDGGSWRPSKTHLDGPKRGCMEPYVIERRDGSLLMLIRTQCDCQYQSVSEDGGTTWSPAEPSPLVSPEAPAAMARDPRSEDIVLVWNNARCGNHAFDRTPLTVALSKDDGVTWADPFDIETAADQAFSYPSINIFDGTAFITYYECLEPQRLSLVLTRIPL